MPEDKIRWRLAYPDGSEVTQSVGSGSVAKTKAGANRLIILDGERPVIQVHLFRADGVFKPIFYRRRSAEVSSSGPTKYKTDLIVFGYGIRDGSSFRGTLYALLPTGETIGCPREHIDRAAIDNLLS